MLKRFNRWYDSLNEPWRFLFFLVVLMGWVPLTFFFNSPITIVISAAWMTIVAAIAMTRI